MFSVGDMVCYPMHGVGVIEGVEEHTILGETGRYYLLRFIVGHMSALVPINKANSVGLRPLAQADTCHKVIDFLKDGTCSEESSNWNQRYRDNLDKLRGGDIMSVADVVKCLLHREQTKGLSTGERKMFLSARAVLVAELSVASGTDEETLLSLLGGE